MTVRDEGEWRPGVVQAVYGRGVDVVIGSRGCWYFAFADVRRRGSGF